MSASVFKVSPGSSVHFSIFLNFLLLSTTFLSISRCSVHLSVLFSCSSLSASIFNFSSGSPVHFNIILSCSSLSTRVLNVSRSSIHISILFRSFRFVAISCPVMSSSVQVLCFLNGGTKGSVASTTTVNGGF